MDLRYPAVSGIFFHKGENMRQEVSFSGCVGKTIEAVEFECAGPQLIITFTDGTFSTVQAECNKWDDSGAEIVEAKLDLVTFGASRIFGLGIMTREELDQMVKTQREKEWAVAEEADRKMYQMLKARFEGAPTDA